MVKNIREQFPWYFLDDEDIDTAWKEGILTVDANVMLDLYRYDKSMREALLPAIEGFKGRFWISHQTAKEFIWNRRSVISGISDDFVKAKKHIRDVKSAMQTAISKIEKLRAIPKGLIEIKNIEKVFLDVHKKINREENNIPDYKNNDKIMERLEDVLGKTLYGGIGSLPSNIEDDLKEATRRKDEKIPPGYMDDGKDGLDFAGDYLMWKQILSYCKENRKPMILVTSESKEDWWQTKSGKTLSPRLELLQEAFEKTEQKFLIYQTDQFVKYHQKRSIGDVDEDVVNKIQEYSSERKPAVSTSQAVDFADPVVNIGRLIINISRPVKNFTGTGQFNPKMLSSPRVLAELIEYPEDTPEYFVRANTGTTFDFNIHVFSNEQNAMLPVGQYILEYRATYENPSSTDNLGWMAT